MNIPLSLKNLTKFERGLWCASVLIVLIAALCGGAENLVTGIASVIGVTALIFVAKGDVLGQILTVVFSLFYAGISFTYQYYGEMITYLCMTAPIAVLAVISWLRHPFEKGKPEVKVNHLKIRELLLMFVAAGAVTALFYWILAAFQTANLPISTISVTTSFIASYLTFRRSPYYALGYAANDIILIVLWVLAAQAEIRYLSMVFCFVSFFVNDLYGFVNWRRMKKRQSA